MNIEEISLWYKYKTKVWENEHDPLTAVIHNIMRVLRSIRGTFNYISTPITSGKLVIDNPHFSRDKIINMNIINGYEFATSLNLENIIIPSELCPTNHYQWEQDHFQALWLSIIAEKCHGIYMNKNWEYSNGCAEELVHVFQLKLGIPKHKNLVFFNTKEQEADSLKRMKNMQVFDHNKKHLSIYNAIALLEKSSSLIKSEKLIRAKELLIKTKELL